MIRAEFEWKPVVASVNGDFDEMLYDRMNAAADEMARSLNMTLYGDDPAKPPPTRWERLQSRLALYRQRIGDAWLVLTGQADIGEW